ncbi:MAG: V-type ATP synthase subunit F [Candidatus Ancaeobacter aquaticus]|nr:V-type ATP synthase subunit F [Candidatus Ancaeobacter aquaticus]
MKIAVVAQPELARGFALLGVEVFGVEKSDEVLAHVHTLIKRADIGLILITERLYRAQEDQLLKLRLETKVPVIMDIPDMSKPQQKLESVADFVLKNTGISI